MSAVLPLIAAFAIGLGSALQTAMLGSLGRTRGSAEATWVSLLGTACALALILAARALRGDAPQLAAPFDRAAVYLAAAILTAVAMFVVVRGDVAPHYVVTGLFGLAFIFGAAALAPRIGVALFLSAAIAGQLIGALALDHIGAFGAQVYAVNATRLLGAGLLLAGVVLVRGIGR
jgi:uncharacterized membrane protein YdcZ (DUF606 family)